MGVAIVRLPNTEYTQSIGTFGENSPQKVKIILLQFYLKFSHSNFFTIWSSQDSQNSY